MLDKYNIYNIVKACNDFELEGTQRYQSNFVHLNVHYGAPQLTGMATYGKSKMLQFNFTNVLSEQQNVLSS